MWDRRPWSIGVCARGSRGGEILPCCELMSLCQKSSHIPWFFIASCLRKRCCTRLEGSFPLYPPIKLLCILLGPSPSPGALAPSFPRGRSYDSRHTSHSAGGLSVDRSFFKGRICTHSARSFKPFSDIFELVNCCSEDQVRRFSPKCKCVKLINVVPVITPYHQYSHHHIYFFSP